MGKPRTGSYTFSGTSASDRISYILGQVKLNDVDQTLPTGLTSLTLNGGSGNDRIVTDTPHARGSLAVFYDGGRGSDTLDFTGSSVGVAVSLYGGARGFSGQEYIVTGFGLTPFYDLEPDYYDPQDPQKILTLYDTSVQTYNLRNIESVVGSPHDDYLSLGGTAGAFADGGAGNDYILGWAGPDTLIGGADNDFLFGKAGNDTMRGDGGADQFQVLTMNGDDVILDFDPGEGDWLYIAWQQATDTIPTTADDWYQTSYVDPAGETHTAIKADFTGGSVTLVGLGITDVAAVMSQITDYHWIG